MNDYTMPYAADVPPASVQQWQWEESLNTLRRGAEESAIGTHWTTTGQTSIDATARAHIAEWLTLDARDQAPATSLPIIDALVHRALSNEPWDLYVVEHHDESSMAVRRLRDQWGVTIRWLEGRTPPAVETTVALRIIHLDPPGVWASTLPLVFGEEISPDDLLPALLRSFGAHDLTDWKAFMRGPGARILLEYALSHLRARAASGATRPFDDRLRLLHHAFSRLESALVRNPSTRTSKITLHCKRVAWIEDITHSPHLLIFDNDGDLRHYRRRAESGPTSSRPQIPHCRLYRATPTQLSSVEIALGALAGLRPSRHGMVRLERRNAQGLRVDPRPCDIRAARKACRQFATSPRRSAA